MSVISRISSAVDLLQEAGRSFDSDAFRHKLDFSEATSARDFADIFEGAIKDALGTTGILEEVSTAVDEPLKFALEQENYLLDQPALNSQNRPRISEFAGESGLNWFEAATLVSVGANGGADYRDWDKIMASPDPVRALSIANGQLFASQDVDWAPNVSDSWHAVDDRILAQSGNYIIYEGADGKASLRMVDGVNRLLGTAGVVPRDMEMNAFIHGFDTQDIRDLADEMEKHNPVLASEMRSVKSFVPSMFV